MLKLILIFILSCGIYAESGLSYLNKIRSQAGLIKLKQNKYLNRASSSHAKYLVRHQVTGHTEQIGRGFYTGKRPHNRALKAGYPSAFIVENLTINTANQKQSIDNLFSAIYHRFVFLTLEHDEIGMGSAKSKNGRRFKSAFVYDLGSSAISQLCKNRYNIKNGVYYIKDICKDKKKMIAKTIYNRAKDKIRLKNRSIVLFPYPNQKGISPVFYNESPDPLPKYGVSGYPISVELNSAIYKNIRLKSFRLYSNGKEIKDTKIIKNSNDKNKIFTKYQFALMPLKRLEYNTTYTVKFDASTSKKRVTKRWSFTTTNPKGKLYRITKKNSHLKVKAGTIGILYFVPNGRNDIITRYGSRGGLKVNFIDQNTFKVKFPKRKSKGRAMLDLGTKKVIFDVI
ncbi:MAG: CAP domain-containing protein [Sulfurovum sp.]